MKIKGKLSISRPIRGTGEKKINITLYDEDACIEFLDLDISLEDFAECLTGLSRVDCDVEVRGLRNIGKIREHKELVFPMPFGSPIDKDLAKIEASKHAPEGWEPAYYFGSQKSFYTKEGVNYARTSMYRWVDKKIPGEPGISPKGSE